MERIASVMTIFKGQEAEYQKRHDELWPEMQETLKKHGASNYSIFLLAETNQLFAYLEVEDKASYNAISQTAICRKWWDYMADIMETNADNSPVAADLTEVFHLV
ncbi:MAG TPA: L-rhamnose mutarotase [Candidatus Jeotgalibaca merdavium]|uniref:L-rhamnose mutarotase n=1 Tax=Candidatus Jeotgalibaca merdavium TaxID=2838627 RepID=A0A9D2I1Z5_9LACT|nr:L-rhamnose mutarotase [Candidatus Jeotgalibaca merdavium]